MYLNELILNWKKVQNYIDSDYEEQSFVHFIKALNSYLYLLNNPKFSAKKDSKSGFDISHEIFSPTYLEDMITMILKPSGLLSNPTLKLNYQSFNYNLHFKTMSFIDSIIKHQLDFSTSEPVFSLCMEMNFQYRPVSKKVFAKDNFVIPLMIFYIAKNLKHDNIKQIREFDYLLTLCNPQVKFYVICETIEQKSINEIDFCRDKLFIIKKSLETDDFKGIDLGVVLSLQKQILEAIKEKLLKSPDFVAQGCIAPIQYEEPTIVIEPGNDQ